MSFRYRVRSLIFLLLTLIMSVIAVVDASATTFRYLTLGELVTEAGAVVRARALLSESHWERGEIWTFTNFEVSDALKGNVSRLVTVRTLGGRSGNLRSIVEGAPQFRSGEEVYLFLRPDDSQAFQILGWSQGTFRVQTEAHTGAENVTQDSAEVAVFDSIARKFRRDGIRNLSIESFHRKINAILNMR